MYQMSTTSTEWSQNVPNILKVFQMAIKYINILQSEALQKFSQIGIFGLKTNHLATLNAAPATRGRKGNGIRCINLIRVTGFAFAKSRQKCCPTHFL
jgi:hypothetical protein